MPRVAFVINRTRVDDPAWLRRACRVAARGAGWEPLILETTRPRDGLLATRRAITAGAELVVAAGGDGTVRACAEALQGTGIALGIVPLGTANIAATALGLPRRLGPALEAALRGGDRRIDIGLAEGRAFVAMAGIGLDAEVVRGTPAVVKGHLGWVGYALAGLIHLGGPATAFSISLDGGPELRRRARSIFVGNAGLLPGGFAILRSARLDDGLLDVAILAPPDLPSWARVGWRVIVGSSASDALLEHHRARHVEIHSARPLLREVDGEVMAKGSSLTVTVLAHGLTVRVPSPPAPEPTRRG